MIFWIRSRSRHNSSRNPTDKRRSSIYTQSIGSNSCHSLLLFSPRRHLQPPSPTLPSRPRHHETNKSTRGWEPEEPTWRPYFLWKRPWLKFTGMLQIGDLWECLSAFYIEFRWSQCSKVFTYPLDHKLWIISVLLLLKRKVTTIKSLKYRLDHNNDFNWPLILLRLFPLAASKV